MIFHRRICRAALLSIAAALLVLPMGCPEPSPDPDVPLADAEFEVDADIEPDTLTDADTADEIDVNGDLDLGPDAPDYKDLPVGETPDADAPVWPITVTVLLDGLPSPDTKVVQGGRAAAWWTNEGGQVVIPVDMTIPGDIMLLASHPHARTAGTALYDFSPEVAVTINLTAFDPIDNEDYIFEDPGEPGRRETTAQCGHCHVTINDQWFASPHAKSAKNPIVHDLYSGTAAAFSDPQSCALAGGNWNADAAAPGGFGPSGRCYIGEGVLPALNADCAPGEPCDDPTQRGDCADCHAPAMNGVLGGRDLQKATGHAFDYGVHCDVCHKAESIDLGAPAGVAGALKLLRPSDPSPSISFGKWRPLTFGPDPDVPNIRMGLVQRDHFREATLCASCHQYSSPALVPGTSLDPIRWPAGVLPVHSTYEEWLAGPFAPNIPCQSCHMPPAVEVLNAADLQLFSAASVGVVGGWVRPPGSVRQHSWVGPRTPESQMLQLAAALFVTVKTDDTGIEVKVRTKNTGPGHALPTGEPGRYMVLQVHASCGAVPLKATGGDAIPDFGGALLGKAPDGDWTQWPGAKVGQVVRVIARPGGHYDYLGVGPFGDGQFDAAAKGMPIEQVVGERVIVAMNGDTPTFDAPLPFGAWAWLGEDPGKALPDQAPALAGAAGFAFGRIMVGADGARQVPPFLAVDIASDNRILPSKGVTTNHRFTGVCTSGSLKVVARLTYRAHPLTLARERGWPQNEVVMVEVTR